MFFIFLLKFIFTKNNFTNPYQIEIKYDDQPDFFKFLRIISEQTKTHFPKKVFVSHEVNAAVFYDTSFWNLFLPTKKNLEIGIALINTVNISELKAIIAHEFGHFSQRSMKIGSYIYTVNRAIYNLVYEYDNWDNLLSKWASAGGVFGLFAVITFWMVERIRDLLRVAYKLINVNYSKLSREMEYHADLVSASVAGREAAINALRKFSFTDHLYQYTLDTLYQFADKGKASENIFSNFFYLIKQSSRLNNIVVKNGIPSITDHNISSYKLSSKIIIKDQWATHPSYSEREKNLNKINNTENIVLTPAREIFKEFNKLEMEMSKKLYEIISPQNKWSTLKDKEFAEYISDQEKKFRISSKFFGYYDDRFLMEFDIDKIIEGVGSHQNMEYANVYNEKNVGIVNEYLCYKNDVDLLTQIAENKIKINQFEFELKKYRKKDAIWLKQKLAKQLADQKQLLINLDKQAFIFNYILAKTNTKEQEYINMYKKVISKQTVFKGFLELDKNFRNNANIIYSKTRMSERELNRFAKEFSFIECKLKDYIKNNSVKHHISKVIGTKEHDLINDFTNPKNNYVSPLELEINSFQKFSQIFHILSCTLSDSLRMSIKELTEFQLTLYLHMRN